MFVKRALYASYTQLAHFGVACLSLLLSFYFKPYTRLCTDDESDEDSDDYTGDKNIYQKPHTFLIIVS